MTLIVRFGIIRGHRDKWPTQLCICKIMNKISLVSCCGLSLTYMQKLIDHSGDRIISYHIINLYPDNVIKFLKRHPTQ